MRKKAFAVRNPPKDKPWLRAEAKEIIKKKGRLYGAIYDIDGAEVYLAWRYQHEIFANGRAFRTEAMEEGDASWALDLDTLFEMNVRGITKVGVVIRDIGDVYVTDLQNFYDHGELMTFLTQGGAAQKYLPLSFFALTRAERTEKNLL